MNRKTNIAAAIEKNRIALLRMVFCWLAAAHAVNVGGDKPLPRRLSAWADDLIFKAEKAAGYLLIAVFYNNQIKRRHDPAFETAAMRLAMFNGAITPGALTITGLIKRLKALQHLLHSLHKMARQLAKRLAARGRIAAMKIAALSTARDQKRSMSCQTLTLGDAIPP